MDVGSGAYPYRRADVLCDKYGIEDEHDCLMHCGKAVDSYNKPFYKIVDGKLPFGDKEFDLVTCACVLEHIPVDEVASFVAELTRVGKKVYIEIPKPFYDMVYNIPAHVSLCDIVGDTIVFIDKKHTSLKKVSRFSHWAWWIRQRDWFALDNHATVNAVGKMFYGNITVKVHKNEDRFWDDVESNHYFCKPPSIWWKIKNRVMMMFPKKHQEEVPYHLRHGR